MIHEAIIRKRSCILMVPYVAVAQEKVTTYALRMRNKSESLLLSRQWVQGVGQGR